jgi:hypothetical protein
MTNCKLSRLFVLAVVLLSSTGCEMFGKPPAKPAPVATTAPAPPPAGSQTYDGSAQYGITLSYPAGFKPVQAGTSIFSADAPTGWIKLFLDYNKLNFVEAGFANAQLVDDHYQSHQKQDWCPDSTATADTPITIPDSDARKVQLTGHKNGEALVGTTALIVHKGAVYVFTAECNAADKAASEAVFNQVVASIRWR